MFPGISPRELKKLLKRMGIDVKELSDVERVIVYTKDREIVISEPKVYMFVMAGQRFFQVMGKVEERERPREEAEIEISEDDIRLVMEQTGASYDEAREALIKTGGDIAEAIIMLRERQKK